MPFNFYDTHTLLMAVQQLAPAATFLRDRYFPCLLYTSRCV